MLKAIMSRDVTMETPDDGQSSKYEGCCLEMKKV